MKTWQLILSVCVFQLTWISAAFSYEWLALIGLIGLIVLLSFSEVSTIKMIIGGSIAISIGVAMDAFLNALSIYHFSDQYILMYLNVPAWLLIMWSAFATSLFSSLYWSLDKPIIFIVLCTIFGPASYLAGREIGVIDFSNEHISIMVLGWFIWSCVFLVFWHFVVNKQSMNVSIQISKGKNDVA